MWKNVLRNQKKQMVEKWTSHSQLLSSYKIVFSVHTSTYFRSQVASDLSQEGGSVEREQDGLRHFEALPRLWSPPLAKQANQEEEVTFSSLLFINLPNLFRYPPNIQIKN